MLMDQKYFLKLGKIFNFQYSEKISVKAESGQKQVKSSA